MDTDGSDYLVLGEGSEPSWSPDGSRITFQHDGNGGDHGWLFTVNSDGSGLTKIYSVDRGGHHFWAPRWSPDGSMLAFAYRIYATSTSVCVIDADGAQFRNLGDGTYPSWSNDGSKIVFAKGGTLYVMDSEGANAVQVSAEGESISGGGHWSPDGSRIMYIVGYQYFGTLMIVDPDGANRSMVLADVGSALWSPDGQRIAVSKRNSAMAGDDIYTVNRDGTDLTRLTENGHAYSPSWSPDGKKITFDAFPVNGVKYGSPGTWYERQVFTIRVDGTELIQLTGK